jgi:hypothetical protein
LHSQHKLNREKAFVITLRVHRGGGFTKDHLYLRGIRNVYKYAKKGQDLGILLTGKVSQEYIPTIVKLQDLGLAVQSKYFTDGFANNDNMDPNLDFILKSLK